MRMNRFVTYVLTIGVCVFTALQCDRTLLPVDSSDKIDYLQGNTDAQVIIKLLDRHSYAPVSGAMVAIVGVDSAKTDSTGTVIFDSVKTGTYLVACSKSGYEGTSGSFDLSIDENSNTVPVVSQSTDVFYLAKKGAAVKGNLYFKNESKLYPANGATIECVLGNASIGFMQPLISTTSNNGTYMFTNLPEYSTYTISVLPFTDKSITYKQTSSVSLSGRAAGDTLRALDVVLEKYTDGNFVVMNHNLETFTINDSVKLEFSESVNTEKLTIDSIYINVSQLGRKILTKNIWSDNNKKLAIIPYDGVWSGSQSYTLVIRRIESINGKPLNNAEFVSYNFAAVTTGDLGDVKNIKVRVGGSDTAKVDYSTSSIALYWSKLANASSYQIFQKTSTDSSWIYATTVTDSFVTLSTSGQFALGNRMQFIVIGRNSTSVSSFEKATVVSVKDNKPPSIVLNTVSSGFNYTSYNYMDTISISISSSYLPEPMDTSKSPGFMVKEAGYMSGSTLYGDTLYTVDPNKAFWTWTSDRSGIANIVIDPLKNGSYDSLKIDFSALTDIAGNRADTTDGRGFITIATRP